MFSAPLRRHAEDLAWSLWTELGVSGVLRNHASIALDLEPILAVTPALTDDPRLLEQVLCWCVAHHAWVNSARLSTLVTGLPDAARARFEAFAATVNAVADTRWPAAGEPQPLPRLREVPLFVERRALIRLRARALCGVGTRADTLCDLLAHQRTWSTAALLAEGGHSKRNVARILSDLEAAHIVVCQVTGNVHSFRLAHPEAIEAVLDGMPAACPGWPGLLSFTLQLLDLASIETLPGAVRRVEANSRRALLASAADRLWLAPPPATQGAPDAWQVLLGWADETLACIARGTSPVFNAAGTMPSLPTRPGSSAAGSASAGHPG